MIDALLGERWRETGVLRAERYDGTTIGWTGGWGFHVQHPTGNVQVHVTGGGSGQWRAFDCYTWRDRQSDPASPARGVKFDYGRADTPVDLDDALLAVVKLWVDTYLEVP